MHNINDIRANPEAFTAELVKRGVERSAENVAALLKADVVRRESITALQIAQVAVKDHATQYAIMKRQQPEGWREWLNAAPDKHAELDQTVKSLNLKREYAEEEIQDLLDSWPNVAAEDVPAGLDPLYNRLVHYGSEPGIRKGKKDHVAIGEELGEMDFPTAAKMASSRFVVLKGRLARFERAIGAFMLDVAVNRGYLEVNPPLLANSTSLRGTGQYPKFAEDMYEIMGSELSLIPTSEVTLTNLVQGDLLNKEELPLRFTALTPCFRSEAGSAGRDTRGLVRQHQFNKVELVSITTPEASNMEHARMLDIAESVLTQLGLPYRVMLLCAGDMGFSAQKTYDIEVWFAAQKRYREISSVSNCGDFQARRMNTRFRDDDGNRFVHTLNGSSLAVGRTLAAIMEYYQTDNGFVIPEVLRPYMGGLDRIEILTKQ